MSDKGVYAITNTESGKVYIGSTVNTIQRWYDHRSTLQRGVHSNTHLQSSWDKYGGDTFSFSVLEYVVDSEMLYQVEQKWMDNYRAKGVELYNFGLAVRHPTIGRKLSDEHRRRISDAHRGKKLSDETRRKISEAHKGKNHTDETRRKISDAAALRGKPYPAFIHEDGSKIPPGENLAKLCREMGLDSGNMRAVINGKRKSCKGWTLLQQPVNPWQGDRLCHIEHHKTRSSTHRRVGERRVHISESFPKCLR